MRVEVLAHRARDRVAQRPSRRACRRAGGRASGGAAAGPRRSARPRRSGTAASATPRAARPRATESSTSPVARRGLIVPRSRRDQLAGRAEDVLGPQPLGERERLRRRLGVEDELQDAAAVAQVDEDQAAVVAAAVHPARDAHLVADARARRARRPRRRGTRWRAAGASDLHASADEVHDGVGLDGPLLAGLHVLQRGALVAEDRDEAGAGPVGLLELALQRAPGELEPRGVARPAGVGGQAVGGRAAARPSRRRRRGRAARARPAAAARRAGSARRRPPSPCRASAARRSAPSARRSARRRRRRSGRRGRRR